MQNPTGKDHGTSEPASMLAEEPEIRGNWPPSFAVRRLGVFSFLGEGSFSGSPVDILEAELTTDFALIDYSQDHINHLVNTYLLPMSHE